LRDQFHFDLLGQVLPFEFRMTAQVGTDHLLDLPVPQQYSQTKTLFTAVIGDNGQILDTLVL
jgi:hypothetical protein